MPFKTRNAELCALAHKLNLHYYAYSSEEGHGEGRKKAKNLGKILHPTYESRERWLIKNKVEEKDADSLTSEWRNYGVEEPLVQLLQAASCRRQTFKKHLLF